MPDGFPMTLLVVTPAKIQLRALAAECFCDMRRANTPATYGAAIDVPESVLVVLPIHADLIDTPGA